MIQGREHPRFAFEAVQTLRVAAEYPWQDFDRDIPFQPGVSRPIDFAHAPCPKERSQLIYAELTSYE
jgi:hypothetical protein